MSLNISTSIILTVLLGFCLSSHSKRTNLEDTGNQLDDQYEHVSSYIKREDIDDEDLDNSYGSVLSRTSRPGQTMFCHGGPLSTRHKREVDDEEIQPGSRMDDSCADKEIEEFTRSDMRNPVCVRKQAFYSIGGVIRRPSFEELSGCYVEDNIESCNFVGNPAVIDSSQNRFTFSSCDLLDSTEFTSNCNLQSRSEDPRLARISNPAESVIYSSSIFAHERYRLKTRTTNAICGRRRVHFCEDGVYELHIRMLECQLKSGDRRFSIMFNDVFLFENVRLVADIPLELIVLFEIQSGKIYLDGIDEPIDLEDGNVDLKFCNGNCLIARRLGFLVSGFSIHKLMSGPEFDACEEYSDDSCDCMKELACEYIVSSGVCRNRTIACRIPCNNRKECYRKGSHVFYLRGGAICQYPSGFDSYCSPWGKVIAVNFGETLTDYKGIKFDSHESVPYEDPDKTFRTEEVSAMGVPEGATTSIYNLFLSGRSKECSCVNASKPQPIKFYTSFPGPGSYEFSFWTVENYDYTEGTREFSLQIDGFKISQGIDPLKYREIYRGLELNFLFQVTLKENGTYWLHGDNYCGTFTKSDGYLESSNCTGKKIEDMRRVLISFHYGECNVHNWYFVSAFSLIQFGADTKCLRTDPPAFDKDDVRFSGCIRKNAFYSIRGRASKPKFENLTGCSIGDNIDSRNLNGTQVEISGINPFTFYPGLLSDPHGIRRVVSLTDVQNIPVPEEKPVYTSAVFASPDFENPSSEICAYRSIHFCEDGTYELYIRVVDPHSKSGGERKFNIKLGNEFLFREVDIFELAQKPDAAVQLIALMEVKSNAILLDGNSSSEIPLADGSVDLKFCYSDCINVPKRGFVVSGYSVHKLEIPGADQCPQFDKKPCECTANPECDYMPSHDLCRNRLQICRPGCNAKDPGCYRKGEHVFYVRGGAICQYPQGNPTYCDVFEKVVAVNFGTKDVTDYRNISFVSHTHVKDFEDPDKIFHLTNATIYDTPAGPTAQIYSEFLWAHPLPDAAIGKPLKYFVKLPGPGRYELSLLTGESFICQPGVRDFSFKLNDIELVKGFDILRYRGKQQGMEINLLFEVTRNPDHTYSLHPDGYCTKRKQNGVLVNDGCMKHPIKDLTKVAISFHFGECLYSLSFPVAGFSIVKFDDIEPAWCRNEIKEFERTALKHPICVKKSAYYSINGVAHKPSFEELSACYVGDNLISCRYGASDQIESGNASVNNRYTLEGCLATDPENVVRKASDSRSIALDNMHEDLYYGHIYGDTEHPFQDSSICASRKIHFCDDGIYELSIRSIDFDSNGIGERGFNIKLGDHFLFREVDLFQLAGKKNTPVHLNTILEKVNDTVRIDGTNNTIALMDGNLNAYFCYSDCTKNVRKNFVVAENTIFKLAYGPELNDCSKQDGNECECIKNPVCGFRKVNKEYRCMNRTNDCRVSCPHRPTKHCLRKGPHVYYSNGGVLCNYPFGADSYCKAFDEVFAVSFGDANLTDGRGVKFTSYNKTDVLIEYPDGAPRVKTFKPETDIPDGPTKILFSSYLETSLNKGPLKFTYLTPGVVGNYELSFIMHDAPAPNSDCRDFKIAIGDYKDPSSFSLKTYRPGSQGIEINFPFQITRDGKNLSMSIFGNSHRRRLDGYEYGREIGNSYDRNLVIALQAGDCCKDHTIYISAISLIRFREMGELSLVATAAERRSTRRGR